MNVARSCYTRRPHPRGHGPARKKVAGEHSTSDLEEATPMAVASPVANVKGFKFGRNLPLLNQKASLGFEVSSGIQTDVVTALLSETAPFPDRDIDLAEVALNAS